MENWLMWTLLGLTGLIVGFIVHALIRYAQSGSVLITLLVGIIGALAAVYITRPYVSIPTRSDLITLFLIAAAGAAVLSFIIELLFVGTTRGRVVTSH